MGQHYWSTDWIGRFNFQGIENTPTPESFKFNNSLTAEIMLAMTQSGNSHDGKAMLEHVVTVVLKQAKEDGLLAKALARGGIHVILDVLTLM